MPNYVVGIAADFPATGIIDQFGKEIVPFFNLQTLL
jgi:hypothetical protein